MREDEPKWFSNWEEQLPKQEELVPISQTLITPELALAFDIERLHNPHTLQPPPPISTPSSQPKTGEPDSSDPNARTRKRPRLVWTPQLHKLFVDAVAYVGFRNAVPKTVMQLMSIDGLTRENVASHLQKYRNYVKSVCSGNVDPGTDKLFASSPVPPQILQQFDSSLMPRQPDQMVGTANGKEALTLLPTGDD